MLVDAGVKYVIIGHSERREYFAETDETVNKKVLKAFEHGITPIICCGETLTQRKQGIYIDWIRMQIKIAFQNVTAEQAASAVIAYEPIWAIGTGETATADQAEEVCAAIRACIAEVYDEATAESIRIQYGGSVNAGNAAELFAKPGHRRRPGRRRFPETGFRSDCKLQITKTCGKVRNQLLRRGNSSWFLQIRNEIYE